MAARRNAVKMGLRRVLLLVLGLLFATPCFAESLLPVLQDGSRVRANSTIRIHVPEADGGTESLTITDPHGQALWSGCASNGEVFLSTRAWADGNYTVNRGDEVLLHFDMATELIESIRARAGLLLRDIDAKRDPDGRPPEALRGASNLLQRVITEHVTEKPRNEVEGNVYFGELALGYRTASRTMRLLGCGAADFMGGYEGPYRPGRFEANSLYLEQGTVVDFAGRGLAMLARWGIEPASVDTVIVSHPHGDHFSTDAILKLARIRAEEGLSPLRFFSGPSACTALQKAAEDAGEEGNLVSTPLSVGETTDAGDLSITALQASHGPPEDCYVYIIRVGENVVFYGTDTGYPPAATVKALSGTRFDAFFVEVTVASAEDNITHMDAGDVRHLLDILRNAGSVDSWTRVVSMHQGRKSLQSLPDFAQFETVLGLESGYDGMPVPVAYRTNAALR